MTAPVRVLLFWPGTDGAAAGNFGVPQLVILATWLRERAGAKVHIVDLVCEAARGPIDMRRIVLGDDGEGYDVIAFSVYSSFDHLKCMAIAEMARTLMPDAVFVAGGYHASARPDAFVKEGSPFDVCVVGEGEKPLLEVVESVKGGAPIRQKILGPDPMYELDELPPSDWSYLAHYRDVARKVAGQAQVYLSRGCPFDCAFCMERAKREVSWRALSVERAVEEIVSLHEWLDLRGFTLYLADALFGMKKSWRRSFLEALARKNLPIEKIWLLIRVDLVEDDDLALFHDANCGLGFGLESGDPGLLATIRKAGRLDTYLERMREVAAWARERNVPWGGNIICGHPGETPETMERSAAYMRDLFLDPKGTTGFLSVDPFRLYPGSPIDEHRGHYEAEFGTRFYRTSWWEDGDPEFLSEWVDPSRDLSWIERERLQHELFAPILRELEANFVYDGPAREYFLRAVREQARFTETHHRLHYVDRYYAWSDYLGYRKRAKKEREGHAALASLAKDARKKTVERVASKLGLERESAIVRALIDVPRERFVPLDMIRESTKDTTIALDETGDATVSAIHAYARAFDLLDVQRGDRVLDLGAGSGYGAAILSHLVGPTGRVVAVELDPDLGADARTLDVTWVVGDARDPESWSVDARAIDKVYAGFALAELPPSWARALREGACVVAPITRDGGQVLVRAVVRGGSFDVETLEAVRYVRARGAGDLGAKRQRPERAEPDRTRRLPVVD
jgi:protein-L-isoaspartate(D-aspartate) O-methyltransferase